MCKYQQILRKYVPENIFLDALDFLNLNNIQYLNFNKNIKIPLKYKNTLLTKSDFANPEHYQQGDTFSGLAKFDINSEYIANIDEYIDTDDSNQKFINFIKINAEKDTKGDYKNVDHCAILIIDMKRKSASIQSLNNYNDCLKCKVGNNDFKIGDVLMRIILAICKKEKIENVSLTDMSYFLCGIEKIQLMYLRTLSKGEPYYCKFGFKPKYNEDVKIWEDNKKIFLNKPSITKKELKKILLDRNFNENNLDDKKILYHINNIILPKLQNDNVISDVIKMIMECKSNISCNILNDIYMRIYLKIGYKKYKDKTFVLK